MQEEQNITYEFHFRSDNKQDFIEGLLGQALYQAGMNLWEDGLRDTPKRIAKMWLNDMNIGDDIQAQKLADLKNKMTTFPNYGNKSHPIVVEGNFSSFCEHHLLPFYGKFRVTYAPGEEIIGLSKIPRIVEHFSSRPQLQERLAKDIGEFLDEVLRPKSIRVELFDVVHTCVKCRGIKSDTTTNTMYTKHRR